MSVRQARAEVPNFRISFVYFAYFCVVGALLPFWGLYLEYLQFSPGAIGFIIAIPMITKILAPNLWGLLADKSGRRLLIARLGAAGSCLCFAGILFVDSTRIFILFIAAYSFFWNAIHAQFEVVTLNYLRHKPETYSHVRLWGSLGFVVVVIGLGLVFDGISIAWLPWFIFAFLAGIFFSSLTLPALEEQSLERKLGDFIAKLTQKPVYLFFLILFLIQFSLGIYHAFFSLYMKDLGYSKSTIGVLWAIGAIAEIILFLQAPALLRRYPLRLLITLTLYLSLLRWILTCFLASWLVIIVFAQCLHALTFGMTHVVAIEFVRRQFMGGDQSQGQAFYNAIGFGAANALGSIVGGLAYEMNGQMAFIVAIVIVLLAIIIQIWASRRSLLAE